MRLCVATRSWLILTIGCWRPVWGLSGSACHEPWAPRREAITSSCYRNVLSAWTAPTCDRTWLAWTLICTWTYCTPRPAATSGYVSYRTVLTCVTREEGVVILEIPPTSIFPWFYLPNSFFLILPVFRKKIILSMCYCDFYTFWLCERVNK